MKKILLNITAIIFLFTSCEDYLEEENLSNVTGEAFYTTEEGFEGLVNSNYAQLRAIYGNEPWLFSAGTDLYAEGRDAEPTGLSQYSDLNPSSEGVGHLYNTAYKAIQVANMGIHYSDLTASTPQLENRIGEIKYLRANAYFLLVQTYGGVGLVTEYISNPVLEFDRNSAEEVYTFIISELEEALNLVEDGGYTGRANKRAVQHLLAKVHLTRGYEAFGSDSDFDAAAQYADAAIGGQGLNLSFKDLWWPGNEMNEEVVFSVQYDASSVSTDPFELGHMQTSFFGPYQGGSEAAGEAPYRTYTLTPTQFAIDLYEQGDERWGNTFMEEVFDVYYDYFNETDYSSLGVQHYYEPKWESGSDQAAYEAAHPGVTYHPYGSYVPSENPNFDYETIPVKKFDDPSAPFGQKTSTRDIILARLGETYLIAAEAYLQADDPATALTYLNEVRRRAGAEPAESSDLDIDYILDERARELLGEYHRWFDLKRTGKLVERASAHHFLIEEENFNGANGELKILRPIPQSAIDLNQNRDFQQNPAYQ